MVPNSKRVYIKLYIDILSNEIYFKKIKDPLNYFNERKSSFITFFRYYDDYEYGSYGLMKKYEEFYALSYEEQISFLELVYDEMVKRKMKYLSNERIQYLK